MNYWKKMTFVLVLVGGLCGGAWAQDWGHRDGNRNRVDDRWRGAEPEKQKGMQQQQDQNNKQQQQRAWQQEQDQNNKQQQQRAWQQQQDQNNKQQQQLAWQQQQDQNRQQRGTWQRQAREPAQLHRTLQQQRAQQVEQRGAWQHHRAHSWESEHRSWRQRGGYNGYRIPDDYFRSYYGRGHWFRVYSLPFVVVGGYPRFQYGGYWFSFVDPIPEYWGDNWYQTDDVYVDYFDDGYYLYNRSYPGSPGVAISISF